MAIPGISVVSVAELAAEMGPIKLYANSNAITGRAGLYPSRYQSDQTDNDRGAIIHQANRRLRCVLMRIADNLALFDPTSYRVFGIGEFFNQSDV